VPAYTYRLLSKQGDDLGPLVSHRGTWTRGARLVHQEKIFVVAEVVTAESDDHVHAYVIVDERDSFES
jgi:hypothetical protein